MLAELLDGTAPFQGDDAARAAKRHLSAEIVPLGPRARASRLAPVLRRALAKAPSKRYRNANEMRGAIRAVYADEPHRIDEDLPRTVIPQALAPPSSEPRHVARSAPCEPVPEGLAELTTSLDSAAWTPMRRDEADSGSSFLRRDGGGSRRVRSLWPDDPKTRRALSLCALSLGVFVAWGALTSHDSGEPDRDPTRATETADSLEPSVASELPAGSGDSATASAGSGDAAPASGEDMAPGEVAAAHAEGSGVQTAEDRGGAGSPANGSGASGGQHTP